jgi:FkbM family methyltransferase
MKLEDIIPLSDPIHVADIGAAYIAETPPYKALMDNGLARLSAFDGDERHKDKLTQVYGENFDLYTDIIADGRQHTLYLASPESGMSSIFKPSEKRLGFFNGFPLFGKIHTEMSVTSRRLDDIEELGPIDFLKMDIQGSELMVLENGKTKLERCVAIQLEVSFAPLYEGQPSFGDIDCWMRANGYLPHRFMDIKRWSIAPIIRDGNFRMPFNQLLEADLVYIKDPVQLDRVAVDSVKTLAYVALAAYGSPDLAFHCLLHLEQRGELASGTVNSILKK